VLALLSGLGTGLALIVAIGAQNAYLLRLALTASTRIVVACVVVCVASDAALILAGVLGVGALVERVPAALLVVRFVGAAFLLTYGVLAARRAIRPSGDALTVRGTPGNGREARHASAPLVTMLLFTWANPHVYLDTLVFLGSLGAQQADGDRWWWTAGAVAASCLWFAALGFGGRLLRPLFARPATWRVFDAAIAVVMVAFGVRLLLGW
jgi:L-lysine exporter family protein LysE/ArgO